MAEQRLIDGDWLLDVVENVIEWDTERDRNRIIHQVRELTPTIEERKKGKWRRRLVDCGFNADWHCSRCGWKTSLEEHGYNFCPNCGADMRGENHETD